MTRFEIKDGKIQSFEHEPFTGEAAMHNLLKEHPTIIDKDMFIVGSEVPTKDGKSIDLLGIDKKGNIVIIEIKQKSAEPRKVIAQIIDYAEWVREDVGIDELNKIGQEKGTIDGHRSITAKFEKEFNQSLDVTIKEPRLYIVSEEIHSDTKRMAEFLRSYDLDLSCIELVKEISNKEKTTSVIPRYVVGPDPQKRSVTPQQKTDYDWTWYSNSIGWDKKAIEKIKEIVDLANAHSKDSGWKMFHEFFRMHISFRRDVKGVKRGDHIVLDVKYLSWEQKIRLSFNWLYKKDEKPKYLNFDFKYEKSNKRWYFEINPDHALNQNEFKKLLDEAHKGTDNTNKD